MVFLLRPAACSDCCSGVITKSPILILLTMEAAMIAPIYRLIGRGLFVLMFFCFIVELQATDPPDFGTPANRAIQSTILHLLSPQLAYLESPSAGTAPLAVYFDLPEAPESEHTTLLGHWGRGVCDAVVVVGNYVYFGNGNVVQSADITDPTTPLLLDQINTVSTVRGMAYSEGYLYVAASVGMLRILDVRDPTDLTEVAVYPEVSPNEVFVSDGYAYVYSGGVVVLDVREPSQPTRVDMPDVHGQILAVNEGYAYVATYPTGLAILDFQHPAQPSQVGSFPTDRRVKNVAVCDGNAYVAIDSNGLGILDVRDPSQPTASGFFADRGELGNLTVHGNYVFLVENDVVSEFELERDTLRIIDVGDPARPVETGIYLPDGRYSFLVDVAATDAYVYLATFEGGLRIVDIRDPVHPVECGKYETGFTHDVAVVGREAYVTVLDDGLRLLDVQEPTRPTEINAYSTEGWAIGVTATEMYAYVAALDAGLQIINMHRAAGPAVVGAFATGNSAYNVALSDGYAYVTTWNAGLHILDIRDPAHPASVGTYMIDDRLTGVQVAGDYAYVGALTTGLWILDVSTPTQPVHVSTYATGGPVYDVALNQEYVFVAAATAGLQIVDVSDPGSPSGVGAYVPEDNVLDVVVAGWYAYVAAGEAGLRILDIHNPADPVEVGYHEIGWERTGRSASRLAVSGRDAYVVDDIHGLYIVRNDLVTGLAAQEMEGPTQVTLAQNYPNPLNSTTAIQYALPTAATVTVTLVDLQGVRVRTLIDAYQAAGQYTVRWNGLDDYGQSVSSGMYLYRLQAGESQRTRKMVVLK